MAANRDYIKDTIIDAMLTNLGSAAVSDEQLAAIDRTAEAIAYPVADEIDANTGSGGINWRGEYDSLALYVANDAVFYATTRSSYVCIAPAVGVAPTDTAYWSLLAQGGDTGATGVGIASSSYNAGTGVLTLTFTDTSTFSTGDLRGADGNDGVGISGASYSGTTGVLTLTFTNGATYSTGDLRGQAGAAGSSVRNGSGAPSAGVGNNGDFYIDTAAWVIYGPKTAGAWGSGTSLVGPAGSVAVIKDTTDGTITTTNNLTASHVLTIPANWLASGNIAEVNARMVATGINQNKLMALYLNTTPNLSGSPSLIGQYQGPNNGLIHGFNRTIVVKSATQIEVWPNPSSATDVAPSTVARQTFTVDLTQTLYLIHAVQRNSSSDTARASFTSLFRL